MPVSRLHGDLEWKTNDDSGSEKKFMKGVIDENDVLTLYKGVPSEYPIISGIKSAKKDAGTEIKARYDLNGRRVDSSYKGLVIEVQQNGQAKLRK